MNSFLLNRQIGSISAQNLAAAQNQRLFRALQAAPHVRFALHEQGTANGAPQESTSAAVESVAHRSGASGITIDPFEGSLLSAGADSSVALWDLEAANDAGSGKELTHTPLGSVANTSTSGSLGITHICFYPYDSLAFLTSSYDHTLKIFSSETLQASATFDLDSIVYSLSVSSVASSHLLVASATQHPAVRLVDLRSGSSSHSLAGHSGSVLAVCWHPRNENILASGATDGCLRIWDVRRSANSLGVLDMEDSIGIAGYDGKGTGARRRERGRAHNGAVNGMTWSSDGRFLISVGHDERMRVWDMTTGANTLANFGPGLKNLYNTALFPLLAPSHLSPAGQETVFFPNPKEISSFDVQSGTQMGRLRIPGLQVEGRATSGSRNTRARTTSLAWRAHSIEMYSAHADGKIRCWRPRTWEDVELDKEEKEEEGIPDEEVEKKRKRDELEQIVRDLTGKRKTYS